MIPRLAFEGLESPEFFSLFGICSQQNEFACFGCDQQKVLVGQEHHLSTSIAAILPGTFSIRHIDAAENAAAENANIKAVSVTAMDNEIGKFRLQVF